jgi:hypothetical protein
LVVLAGLLTTIGLAAITLVPPQIAGLIEDSLTSGSDLFAPT